jgi:hypothetical protein
MINEDVIDLFDSVRQGATVVVLAPGQGTGSRRSRGFEAEGGWCSVTAEMTADVRLELASRAVQALGDAFLAATLDTSEE